MAGANEWLQTLGVRHPIFAAPMAGGPSTPELVAAVSDAGGLGFLGVGYLSPDDTRAAIRRVRALTDAPFGVNVFIPEEPTGDASRSVMAMKAWLREWVDDPAVADEIDGVDPRFPALAEFEAQMDVILEERVPILSFTFGCPGADTIGRWKAAGACVIGTATTPEEAVALEQAGCDAVIAQGYEAGGHRGSFLPMDETRLIGTMALVPQVVDRVSIPVIAAGGIMDGRGIVACMALGAVAVQMGTSFLVTHESGAHPAYKRAVMEWRDRGTALTRSFSGRHARGIRNAFMEAVGRAELDVPPYPLQNTLTQPIRRRAAVTGDAERMSLWAGQGYPMAKPMPAADMVRELVAQMERVKSLLC
ncbi:NAD(P)H-dependent flavin oxidoreductase [Alicyclobacillus mali (ex Roth et al. 2021)]|uniref:NAD(P)H-dependent flavin oxidoreductase n=1 Tax=Alicyclobacillus mali (ex Roth et al. 2021) TaxID=1123961 RepID=UPI001A8FB9A0|nr:nitronate monooxygenase [Alicyclobacillus mali (ex Roth et al. 2021)]MCL6489442.1 nitronate monooxygenase [Alicyclobacillus mali (ex Roth et al. 2021)]